MPLRLAPLTLLAVLLAALPASAQYRTLTPEAGDAGPKRAALVLGNAAYTHATPLRNPTNDAADVAEALRRTGFTVVAGTDLSQQGMDEALAAFTREARGAEAAAFFYAGHGVEVDGENYLIPVDANIQQRAQVRYRSLALGAVLGALEDSGAQFKLVMLDACRNDPFRSWRSAGGGGWGATQGPSGTMIVYGTGPGSVASDNPNEQNGLFTAALLEELETPGVEASRLMRLVGHRVIERSGGEQQPWVSASYAGDFFFVPEGSVPEGSAPPPSRPSDGGAPDPTPPRTEPAPPPPSTSGYQPPADRPGLFPPGDPDDRPLQPVTLVYQMEGGSHHSEERIVLKNGFELSEDRGIGTPTIEIERRDGTYVLHRTTLAPVWMEDKDMYGDRATFDEVSVQVDGDRFQWDRRPHILLGSEILVLGALPLEEGETLRLNGYQPFWDWIVKENPYYNPADGLSGTYELTVTVEGTETITVPAGTFETRVVTWSRSDRGGGQVRTTAHFALEGPPVAVRFLERVSSPSGNRWSTYSLASLETP